MLIYNFDRVAGEFVGTAQARLDPLETKVTGRDVYLLPGASTTLAPPETGSNEVAIWDGAAWGKADDYRGSTIFSVSDKSSATVSDIGPIADGYTLAVPGEFDSWDGAAWVTDTVAQGISSLTATRSSALDEITHDFGDGRVIQVRAKDESNIRNAIERMKRLSVPTQVWFMTDNSPALVTVAELQTALDSGQDKAAAVWSDFFTAVAAL